MLLTAIFVWIGLSILASVLVLAAVIRSGQMEQLARDSAHEEELLRHKPPSKAHTSNAHVPVRHMPGHTLPQEQEWGAPIRTSCFTSDPSADKP